MISEERSAARFSRIEHSSSFPMRGFGFGCLKPHSQLFLTPVLRPVAQPTRDRMPYRLFNHSLMRFRFQTRTVRKSLCRVILQLTQLSASGQKATVCAVQCQLFQSCDARCI